MIPSAKQFAKQKQWTKQNGKEWDRLALDLMDTYEARLKRLRGQKRALKKRIATMQSTFLLYGRIE